MNVFSLISKRRARLSWLALFALSAVFMASPAAAKDKKADKESVVEIEQDAVVEDAPAAEETESPAETATDESVKEEETPAPEEKAEAAPKKEPQKEEKKQAKAAPEKKAAPLKVDYAALESAGLYKSEREGGLGANLWNDSKRSDIVYLLKNTPSETKSRTLTELQKRLLLSAADTKKIVEDVKIEPGQDLLTLRLEKLLDIGAYREAADLYALLNDEPYHERLGRAGTLALLYGGEKSLACLEGRTLQDRFAKDEFWKDFLAYCAVSIEEQPPASAFETLRASNRKVLASIADNANFIYKYEPVSFGKLSQLEQAALLADDRLQADNIQGLIRNGAPTRDLRAMLRSKKISDRDRMLLTAETVNRGITPVAELVTLYKAQAKPAAGDAAAGNESGNGDWEKLAALYNKATISTDNAETWNIVREAFAYKQDFGLGALIPFAAFLGGLNPEAPSLQDIHSVLEVMNGAGEPLSGPWDKALAQIDPATPAEKDLYFQTLIANYASKPAYQQGKAEREKIEALALERNIQESTLVNIIIENLDKGGKDINNAPEIYEKDFGLTLTDDYVMPSVTVWDRLRVTSQEKRMGETILLSAAALRGQQPQHMYPGLLRDVLGSYETVGLTNISGRLAAEALLEE